MGQSFGPDRAADRVPQHWASSGRDLGESVKNFIHVLTDASMRLSLKRKMLRRVRPCVTASLVHYFSQLAESPQWLETGSRKTKLLESPGVPELEEPLGRREKIFGNWEPRQGWVLGSMTHFPVQGHLGAKGEHSRAPVRFLGERGWRQEEKKMKAEKSN